MMIFLWALVLTSLVLQGVDGTSWPGGKYALLKPVTGCPEGWEGRGWLLQDTENTNPSNKRSETLHIDGLVTRSNVIRSFCVKTAASDQEPKWPQGQYCMYRKRGENILTGMRAGWMKMYDETTSNKDTAIYVSFNNWILYSLSSWYKHLALYFQCNTSGNNYKKRPISLPITKPFYLLPYGSRDCQQVKWMVATSEWIKYHTNNYINRSGQKNGTVPYHELGNVRNNKGITMYYCYYQSCNYTLSGTKGVFQSPGFPGKYPDGQLCSWRIMVPDNHTLHVHFTNFSLDENDNVTFKNSSGSFYLHDIFQGHLDLPFTITATSDVLFVFQTNEEEKNTGFRAEYTVSKASGTTPSPPPITTENIGQHTTLNTNSGSLHGSTPTTEDIGKYTTLNTNTGELHGTTTPTTETKNKANSSTADTFKKSHVGECDGSDTTVLVVVPLICLIVVIAVIIILYRWRSKKTECEKCSSTRYPKEDAMNPTYDDAGHIQIHQRISTATMNTTLGTDDNDGQMYQALSGDHDQQPQYEAPDYSKQNGIDDPSNDSGYPEYHELEPMDNNVPDVVYDVLEGPDSNDGPSEDQMYQALNKETTHNPLYQSTHPATMVTKNPMYVDSVA